jgi:hypothetical protein
VPEFVDPVSAKTSPERSFLLIENERFWEKEIIFPIYAERWIYFFFVASVRLFI